MSITSFILPASFFQANQLALGDSGTYDFANHSVIQTGDTTASVSATGANVNITTVSYSNNYTGSAFQYLNPIISTNTSVSTSLISQSYDVGSFVTGSAAAIITTSGQNNGYTWITVAPGVTPNATGLNGVFTINTVIY